MLDLGHRGDSCSACIPAQAPVTPLYIGCLSSIDSIDTRVLLLPSTVQHLFNHSNRKSVRLHCYISVCPTLQLSHNDVLGVAAVWVVRVGGPESVRQVSLSDRRLRVACKSPAIRIRIAHMKDNRHY